MKIIIVYALASLIPIVSYYLVGIEGFEKEIKAKFSDLFLFYLMVATLLFNQFFFDIYPFLYFLEFTFFFLIFNNFSKQHYKSSKH